jgi:MFS family permease
MPEPASLPPPSRLTFTHWLIVVIAAIGFAFDIYELLMLPLILRPALEQLVGAQPGTEAFNRWLAVMFYVPAFAGGIFGLLGGYLTDKLGRRRVLTGSILLYAVSAFLAGFSTNIWMLLVLRCTTFIGVCVEFVAAVAWLAELFPNPQQRERVLGYTQAFSSLGGLLVAVANGIAVRAFRDGLLPPLMLPDWAASFLGQIPQVNPESGAPYTMAWRYTLMSGLIPAIPLVLIRPFLPESPVWARKKAAGTLKRPSLAAIFAPELRRTTIVTALMVACSYGAAFGAIQMIPQIVPGLEDVRQAVEDKPAPAQKTHEQLVASEYVKLQEIGGLTGRLLLALLAVRIVSRRRLLRTFQIPGLLFVPLAFYFFLTIENRTFFEVDLSAVYLGTLPITTMSIALFLCGLLVVAQFSFWGNYLPRVYPVHLRGTGESFAANIGGRMIGTSFAALTGYLAGRDDLIPGTAPQRYAYAAAAVALFVYVCGVLLSFRLPEPKQEALPE